MCGGFKTKYTDPTTGQEIERKIYFPIPNAQIPFFEGDTIKLATWGRRKEEPGSLPPGGWARLDSLAGGKWNQYNPSKVRIPALSWMEKDKERVSHWFDMEPDTFLLGVRITREEGSVIYIVTKQAEGEHALVHDRVPLIVGLT